MLHAAKCREMAYLAQTASWERMLRGIERAALAGHTEYEHDMTLTEQQARCLIARGFTVQNRHIRWGQFGEPPQVDPPTLDPNQRFRAAMEAFEKRLILSGIKNNSGNITQTAAKFSMNRTTLVEKMRKYGIKA